MCVHARLTSHFASHLTGLVRCLTIRNTMLYSGASDNKVKLEVPTQHAAPFGGAHMTLDQLELTLRGFFSPLSSAQCCRSPCDLYDVPTIALAHITSAPVSFTCHTFTSRTRMCNTIGA